MCFIIKIGENMNNKGFTLIELLAVVILLITISLFVMPRIVDVIKEGDKTKENITKNKIIEAAKEYTSNYDTNFLNDLVNVGDSKYIDKEELINNKLLDTKDIGDIPFIKVKVILKEDNKIEYIIVDSATVSRPNYGNAVDYINNLYDIEDFRKEDGLKKDNTSDANIRYEGANPNNYVKFNDELWRIIGVFGNNVKIVRKDTSNKIEYKDLGDENIAFDSFGMNIWGPAKWGPDSNSLVDYPGSNVLKYLTNTVYSNINAKSKLMIENKIWNIGMIPKATTTTVDFYNAERGSKVSANTTINYQDVYVVSQPTWQGYIAIPYLTDLTYSSSEEVCQNDFNNTKCSDNNWLIEKDVWTLSPADTLTEIWHINSLTNKTYASIGSTTYRCKAFPTLYLKNSISIVSGLGTEIDPYILQ